jgi:hypothetical protein
MAAHVELFSRLIMQAKLVGIGYTSHERAAMFVGTILGPAFRPAIAEINAVEETKGDWPMVLSKYNAESARREARPLVRSTAARGGAVLATVGEPRISREAAEHRRKDRRPDMSKIGCYGCHKTGHYARDCWSKMSTDGIFSDWRRRMLGVIGAVCTSSMGGTGRRGCPLYLLRSPPSGRKVKRLSW